LFCVVLYLSLQHTIKKMTKTIKTSYTDAEFRQLIRDEVQAVINNIPGMPAIKVNEGYLTVQQAADLIKLAKGTVYGLVHRNAIPYHKSGKRVLFKRSELESWLLTGLVA
jgi:excisionase family DNA binding protein